MTSEVWQFWIDVGGTFTDCLATSPDGQSRQHKLLSSGATSGGVGAGSTRQEILDSRRGNEPAGFWDGYQLRLFDESGGVVEESRVVSFEPRGGRLRLDPQLGQIPPSGWRYELASHEDAPLVAMRYVLGLRLDQPLPAAHIRLGTTRGTNALLTRTGARTALVTTLGLGDILEIRDQQRPRLFDLNIRQPSVLYERVIEVDERLSADGRVLRAPDPEQVKADLADLRASGVKSLAICLLHAYAFPQHETLVAEIARSLGFAEISLSSSVAPLIKLVPRGDTVVADAYLNPVLQTYVGRLQAALDNEDSSSLRLLTSAGGLVRAEHFFGKDSILSGPAGGVVGFSHAARAAGFPRAIGFDMGGTSTDVSRFDGEYEMVHEAVKGGVHISTPMLAIETVAAGGGSICGFDGVQLTVGPASAGAEPGPACYGRGGPLTLTDMNLILGRIGSEQFPFPLDRHVVEVRLTRLCQAVATSGRTYQPLELAEGFLRIANAHMARAIQSISTARGYDPRQYVLMSFGGAAPQHACAVAMELGIRQILNHPAGGILSAVGIGMADVVRHQVRGIYRPLEPEVLSHVVTVREGLQEQVRHEVRAEGFAANQVRVTSQLDVRYAGQEAYLTIDVDPAETLVQRYHQAHRRRYGYADHQRGLEIVAVRVAAVGSSGQSLPVAERLAPRAPRPHALTVTTFAGQQSTTPVFLRCDLLPGDQIEGPAIVAETISTTVIDPDWTANVLSDGQLLLTHQQSPPRTSYDTTCDPVLLEVFHHAFTGVAEQMGMTLRNTASSVNVKERLDFSCALFTAQGALVVNAPHMPVHLGAMSETIRHVIADHPELHPDDALITNDPYRGGSHLPDVTVVTPVFDAAGKQLLFFTASRAHHAEIGGILPGSMPPFSRNLAEEGVLIRSRKVVDAGCSRLEEIGELLASGPFPSRAISDNLADITAQIAANQQGVTRLHQLVERYGQSLVLAYMGHIQMAAERKMRSALRQMPDGRREFRDALDDGAPIQVAITVHGDTADIDFAGSAPVHPENLNANKAIVRAAVIYALRCLIDQDIPLNEGMLRPIRLLVPEGILNPPDRGDPETNAAVVGGNVETSQRMVDVLLGAFDLAAASQGTMNNLLFGDASFGYYETICGGAGATPLGPGANAVHTHMTNTRLTDPEVLEQRYPVRLLEFRLRHGSGGAGRHPGGVGAVRRLKFLRELDVSIVSQRRDRPPFGLDGGQPGSPGCNCIERAGGTTQRLGGRVHIHVHPGDVLSIETPGGGGYGRR